MPPQRSLLRQRNASFVCAAIAIALSVFNSPASAVDPLYTVEERAFAVASPSLIYLEAQVTGFLRRKDTGEKFDAAAILVSNKCTGFAVSAQGHAISATHCVRPTADAVHRTAASQLAASRVRAGHLQPGQREAFAKEVLDSTDFTGETQGSKAKSVVLGQPYKGEAGAPAGKALEAEVVASQSIADGDVVLLKFASTIPAVQLAEAGTSTGSPATIVSLAVDSDGRNFLPRFKPAKITGEYGSRVPPSFQMDADLGEVSLGGMVVDASGRVVGMINVNPSAPSKVNNHVTNLEHIKRILSQANTQNSASPADDAYRAGLNSYFSGRYSDAGGKFDAVLAAHADHPLAASYKKFAAELLAVEGEKTEDSGLPGWALALIVSLAAALVAAVGLIFYLNGKRRSATPAATAGYSPATGHDSGQAAEYDYMSIFRQPSDGAEKTD